MWDVQVVGAQPQRTSARWGSLETIHTGWQHVLGADLGIQSAPHHFSCLVHICTHSAFIFIFYRFGGFFDHKVICILMKIQISRLLETFYPMCYIKIKMHQATHWASSLWQGGACWLGRLSAFCQHFGSLSQPRVWS